MAEDMAKHCTGAAQRSTDVDADKHIPAPSGAVRKTETAEVRVSRNSWKGRDVIDIRIWFLPRGGGEFVPSRKGLTIDARKLPSLVDALREFV